MDIDRLLKRIEGGIAAADLESEQLDFKLPRASFKDAASDLASAAVCFANASGGILIVGVRDHPGGSDALVGCDLDTDELRARIFELTTPGLVVSAERHVFRGKRYVVVTVPEGLQVHADSRGIATRRFSTSCLPMEPRDIARLDEERRRIDWASGATDVAPDALDTNALRLSQSFLASKSGTAVRRSDPRILQDLGLVADGGRVSRAGVLLLGSSDDDIDRMVYQYARTPGGEPVLVRRWSRPLLAAFEDVLGLIRARLETQPVTLNTGVQLQIEDFPLVAIREAIANAIVHGDHRLERPIAVEHSPASLRVVSSGPLVAGISVDNILTKGSRARFPTLARAFRQLGLAEEIGQGVDRMFREMIRSGRDVPSITADDDEVTVTFAGQAPNVRLARLLNDLPDEERDDTDALLILHRLVTRRSVTAVEMSPVIQRTVDDAERVLRRLSQESVDLLRPTPGTAGRRHPNYRLRDHVVAVLGPSLSYIRRDTRELDRKVVEHVREYGYINNATLQRLFDADVYVARDMLRDLVGREILVRTSTQRRGKAVKYGAGPRFPSKRGRKS